MKRQMTEQFKLGLQILSMRDEIGTSEGLKFPDDKKLTHYEKLHFIEADNYKPSAIFFRKFENRPSVPAAYIYDFTTEKKNDKDLKGLYKRLWNSCKIPFFIVFEKEEVRIFNLYSKSGKDIDKKLSPYETIKLAAGASREFNARELFSGALWERDKAQKEIKKSYGAYESFLSELKIIREKIKKESKLKVDIANSLLIKFILIKYLEERKVFKEDYWTQFYKGAESFLDTFKNNKAVIGVLENLSSHFNGGIFRLDEDEKREIAKSDLTLFASFLKGDSTDDQLALWRLYSFEDLPVELISNIYEDFLENKSGGVVYTPPLLVDFMIDEVMPLDKPQENFSVFDPACGSGIFLVAAYKRMIQWWMVQNDWKKPGVRVLKSLLKKSIFGIDISGEASQLAIFSLSLALCDVLSPKAIWDELTFDDLSKGNILSKDFFEMIQGGEFNNRFDLVIGNPPFIAKLTPAAFDIENIEKSKRVKVPDKQISLLFLEQSFRLCRKKGYVCLVQPAGPFLYNQQIAEFKKHLFEKISVREVIDFTCLRKSLFNSADVATAVIICENSKPDNQDILHLTVRESKTTNEKIFFELDKYDFHYIQYDEAINNKHIWKINLLGGGRIKHLINRLSTTRTFGEYLKEKVKHEGWLYQEGFNKGNKKIEAKYLLNSDYLPPDALDLDGINYDKTQKLNDFKYELPRPKELYEAPILLIREVFRKEGLVIGLTKKNLSFSKQIVGIKNYSIDELDKIYKILHRNKLFSFYIFINSGRLASFHSSILKADIDNLPFPENEEELKLNLIEELIVKDTFNYMIDYFQGIQNPAILNLATLEHLIDFGKIYIDLLNSVYKKFIPLEPIIAGQFICYPFSYGESPGFKFHENSDIEKDLIELVHKKSGENILIKRNIRLYDDKIILLIKPKQLRYWMKSIAVRDADETFADLIEMGY